MSEEIDRKVKSFAEKMNAAVTAKRDAKLDELVRAAQVAGLKPITGELAGKVDMTRARSMLGGSARGMTDDQIAAEARAMELADARADADAKLVKLVFRVSKSPATLTRTGKQQAALVAKGVSWTCSSNHMGGKARHVDMLAQRPDAATGKLGKRVYCARPKDFFGSAAPFFMTYDAFTALWTKTMAELLLRNYKGQAGFAATDAYHLELAGGRLGRSDSEVVACMTEYARLTRIDGKSKNTKFETGGWKDSLKSYLTAAEKTAKEAKEAAAAAEAAKKAAGGGR